MTPEQEKYLRAMSQQTVAVGRVPTATLVAVLAELDTERAHSDALAEAMYEEGHGDPRQCPMRETVDDCGPCLLCANLATHRTRRAGRGT